MAINFSGNISIKYYTKNRKCLVALMEKVFFLEKLKPVSNYYFIIQKFGENYNSLLIILQNQFCAKTFLKHINNESRNHYIFNGAGE